MRILGESSALNPNRKIGKTKYMNRLKEKVYDSRRDGVLDRGYYVLSGSIILKIFPIADPDSGSQYVLHTGSWLFSDIVSHMSSANYGISIQNNDKLSKIIEFNDSEFQQNVFKNPAAASKLFESKMETMSHLVVSKAMADYYPPKEVSNVVEENLQYSRVVCEILLDCANDGAEEWILSNTGPQSISLNTGIPKRTINVYIKNLTEQGVIKRIKPAKGKEGGLQVNIKKALSLVEGKPISSLHAVSKIARLKDSYLYKK